MTEYDLQVNVTDWIRWQLPCVLFYSDLNGVKLTIGTARKVKRIQHEMKWLDLFFPEPRRGYNGLFLELKKSAAELRRADGSLRQTAHLQEQQATIDYLQRNNYHAVFVAGFDEAIAELKWYFEEDLRDRLA